MHKARVANPAVAAVAILIVGCAGMFSQTDDDQKPRPTSTRILSYYIPKVVNPDPAGQPDEREIDGIAMSVTPGTFTAHRSMRTVLKELPTYVVMNDQYNYQKTEIPRVSVTPATVTLHAKLTNRLDHVLRLGGAVFSCKVNGQRLSAVSGAEELLGAVLAPGDSQDADLVLGQAASIPDGATIALDLFDVPTATDAAGNPTKKTAFRWVFKFIHVPKEERVPVTTSDVQMTRGEAAPYLER